MADNVLARVPADMDPIAATTTYLFQLGYNALLKGNVTSGNRLAIVGLGTLGLATAALGAVLEARIHAFSNQVFSRDVLEKFHISTIFRKSDAGGQYNIEQVTGGHGIDVVVSTSNTWDDWRLALCLPRREGIICVLGFPGRGAGPPLFNPLSSEFFYDRQLKIVACGMTPNSDGSPGSGAHTLLQNCKFILGLIASGRLPARTLISAVVPWREVGSIYERIVAPEPAFLTAALTWT
jgi:threonine dehydrogenase-like Zn-dependent dehydrogenase